MLKTSKVGMKQKHTFAPEDLDPEGPIFARIPALEMG
jgi:hypothetical protein